MTPASFRGDAEWYRGKARERGGPVLELGAGTGRITLGIAQDGVPVHALDADPAMLDRLRQKLANQRPEVRERVVVVVGDMRMFMLVERFALIIAPFRGFLHNLTEHDQLACLDRVREHLRPDGCFAFNVFHPSLEYVAQHTGALAGIWRRAGTFPRADGRVHRAFGVQPVRHGAVARRFAAPLRGVRTGRYPHPDIAAPTPACVPISTGPSAPVKGDWFPVGSDCWRV